MSNIIYAVNKGINRPLEFRGLKAQYIWYLAGGIVGILVLFSILYISGLNAYLCIAIAFILGVLLFFCVYKWNNRYGQYGWMQMKAKKKIPRTLKSNSRTFLMQQ